MSDLYGGAVDVKPTERDWSEGWGDTWQSFEAPMCPEHGNAARWIAGDTLLSDNGIDLDALREEYETLEEIDELTDEQRVRWAGLYDAIPRWEQAENEDHEAWRCADPACDHFGNEVEPQGDEGPMMNYDYALPSLGKFDDAYQAADAIRGVSLCIVERDGDYSLALTGGGMDMSWDIVKAFIILGFLPPAHFAGDLPKFAGMTPDPAILQACRASLQWQRDRADRAIERFEREYPGVPAE